MMPDPGFVSGFIGYGITKTLDEVLRVLQQSMAFPKEYLKLYSRLLRVKPMVEAIEQAHTQTTPEPASHQEAVEEWLKQMKESLGGLEKLLEEGKDFKQGRLKEPMKKRRFVVRLAEATESFEALQSEATHVSLVKMNSVQLKQVEVAKGTADDLERLSEVIQTTAEEQASETQRNQERIMEAVLELKEKMQDVGFIKELVQSLSDPFQVRRTGTTAVNQPVDHPLASVLKTLSEKTGRDKRCKVKLEIIDPTDDPPNRFRPPREIVSDKPAQESPSGHRGRAIEGGFEVHNDTKVQLTFEVTFSEDWFFYIIQVDHAAEGSRPEIFFPKSVGEEEDYNRLSRRNQDKRVFPRKQVYEDDPLSLNLVRSKIAATDSYDRVSLYVLVVNTCLTPDREPSDAITIEDVENALDRMSVQESDSKNVIVNRFQFDLKPSLLR